MGIVYAPIILKNAGDITSVDRGIIAEREIRETAVTALVDTGAGTLVIDEETCGKLGLKIKGLRGAYIAKGERAICKITEPVEIHWKDRQSVCSAVVMQGLDQVLLGAIPLEEMDLVVNPAQSELTGAHGDEVMMYNLYYRII